MTLLELENQIIEARELELPDELEIRLPEGALELVAEKDGIRVSTTAFVLNSDEWAEYQDEGVEKCYFKIPNGAGKQEVERIRKELRKVRKMWGDYRVRDRRI